MKAKPAGPISVPDICLVPRLHDALEALHEALAYAADLQQSVYDFAVEIAHLRRLNLSNNDLRWLIEKGLIEHAVEVTEPADVKRSFRRPSRSSFHKRAAFVLTPQGANLARELFGTAVAPLQSSPVIDAIVNRPVLDTLLPTWDRDRQTLRVGTSIVKQFKVPAANQEIILAAFQEQQWAARIDDPLPPHHDLPVKRRLQETIKSLNRNQKQELLRFFGDGSGQGVRWEFCAASKFNAPKAASAS